MKLNCAIVKDLLPLYADDLCSDETTEAVRAHLAECDDCRRAYEAGTVAVTPAETADETPVKPFRKVRRVITKRVAIIAACVTLVAAISIGTYAHYAIDKAEADLIGDTPAALADVTVKAVKEQDMIVAHYCYPEWGDQKRIEFATTDTVVIDEKTHRLMCNGEPVVNPDDPDSFVGDKGCHGLYVCYGCVELTFSDSTGISVMHWNNTGIDDFSDVNDISLFPVPRHNELTKELKQFHITISTQSPERYLRIIGSDGIIVYDLKKTFWEGKLVEVDASKLSLPEPNTAFGWKEDEG